MKGQQFGISGKKATINSVVSKPKGTTPIIQKKSSVTSPKKPINKEPPKKAPQPKIQKLAVIPKEPELIKLPEPIVTPKQEPKLPPPPPPPPAIRQIRIRYSHYKQQFQAIDDYLPFESIDVKYCISFVFKGQFVPKLKDPKTSLYANKQDKGWLVQGDQYILEVDEDQVEEAKYERKTFKAQEKQECPLKRNKRIDELTKQLKGLSAEELKQKGDKYRELIEQRDLQDILYK